MTFALAEDAARALQKLEDHKLGDNKLLVKFAKSRTEQQRSRPRAPVFDTSNYREPLLPREKPPRQKTVKKKSRLIVRNLSFQVGLGALIASKSKAKL